MNQLHSNNTLFIFSHHQQALVELAKFREFIPAQHRSFFDWLLSLMPNLNIARNDCQACHTTYGLRVKSDILPNSARRFSQRQARKAENLNIISIQEREIAFNRNDTNIITIHWGMLFDWIQKVSPTLKVENLVNTLLQKLKSVAQTRSFKNIKKRHIHISEIIQLAIKAQALFNQQCVKRGVSNCLASIKRKKTKLPHYIVEASNQAKARDSLIKELEKQEREPLPKEDTILTRLGWKLRVEAEQLNLIELDQRHILSGKSFLKKLGNFSAKIG